MDNRHILGIDVGTMNTKVFIGAMGVNRNILVAGNGAMPTAGFVKGAITDVEALAMSISQAVECAIMATNISVKDAYIGIGGTDIHFISSTGSIAPLSTAAVTYEDIERVYQAAIVASVSDDYEVLHILPKSFLVDKQRQVNIPLHQKCARLEVEVQIVTMLNATLNRLVEAVDNVGIHVLGGVAKSTITTQVLSSIEEKKTLFMDIGAGTTDLVLYRGMQLDLAVSLPLGGDYITSDIMKGLGISFNHAEEIKKYYAKLGKNLRGQNIMLDCNDYGTTDKEISYDFLYDIVESRIEEIVYLIHDYLKSSTMEHNIEKIFITGGCGAMPSFSDSIEKLFGIPIGVVIPKELQPEYASPMNTACYGVLTYAVNHLPDIQVNDGIWHSLLCKFKKIMNR